MAEEAPAAPELAAPELAALLPLLRELGDLKRIRSAGRDGSIANRLFLSAWSALAAGEAVEYTMNRICAAALCAARLGDLDRTCLHALGLSQAEATDVLRKALVEVSASLEPSLVKKLESTLVHSVQEECHPPDFAWRLADQPRAGITCPGKPRIMLQPTETHAEHCLMVCVYAVLAAPIWHADPACVFLAGLAHHLHNAVMPDAGYTGEMLLGETLAPAMTRAREAALLTMPRALATRVRKALASISDDGSAETHAFHSADVLDRVLEIEQHLGKVGLTMDEVLGPYALVHESPLKPLHDRILADAGFA